MKKPIIFIALVLVLPVFVSTVLYQNMKNFNTSIAPTMHYLMTPTSEQNDIIYIGASRTLVHIDPRVIDTITGLKGYNLGLDGSTIVYYNMVLCKYLQCHPKPKYVVINTDYGSEFDSDFQVYNYPDYQQYLGDSLVSASLCPYLPLYRQNFLMKAYHLYQELSSMSDDYKISYLVTLAKYSWTNKPSYTLHDTLLGFSPHISNNQWDGQSHNVSRIRQKYTPEGFELLRKMIKQCKEKDIKVILMNPPFFKNYRIIIENYGAIKDSIENIAAKSQVPFWNYSDSYLGLSTVNFYNVEHMNSKGAYAFSRVFGEDIKHYMADSTYFPDIAASASN